MASSDYEDSEKNGDDSGDESEAGSSNVDVDGPRVAQWEDDEDLEDGLSSSEESQPKPGPSSKPEENIVGKSLQRPRRLKFEACCRKTFETTSLRSHLLHYSKLDVLLPRPKLKQMTVKLQTLMQKKERPKTGIDHKHHHRSSASRGGRYRNARTNMRACYSTKSIYIISMTRLNQTSGNDCQDSGVEKEGGSRCEEECEYLCAVCSSGK